MKIQRALCIIIISLAIAVLSSCSQNTSVMQDGYYAAQIADYDDEGWQEYITIYVSDDKIVTVEYDARNASGFVRSWDMGYMRKALKETGTYPNEYVRSYSISLLNWQDPEKISPIPAAEHDCEVFKRLATAAIEQAKNGDKHVAVVVVDNS